jgi:dipeptidyl aminopeptidase/acylaminoacyl peptidase
MTPDRFAAAVSVVGISDLARFLETTPPYWQQGIHGWYLYVGDPARADQRRAMLERSPISFAAQAEAPALLVHGANDVRVRAEQSTRMAATLRELGKPVELMLFEDEGHGIRKHSNRLRLYRAIERFLAEHLGGRAEIPPAEG